MKVLRQKMFIAFAPLIAAGARALPFLGKAATAASTIGTGVMIKQGIDSAKQQEEFAKQQEEQNRRMTKALNKIAEQASNNPQTAQAAYNVMTQAQDRQFSVLSSLGKFAAGVGRNTIGLGKNVGKIALENKKVLIGGTLAGTAMGGSSYVTDKFIQKDMKKNNIPMEAVAPPIVDEYEYSDYPYYDDNYYGQRSYSIGKSILSGAKKVGKTVYEAAKEHKGNIALTTAMSSIPLTMGYLSTKQAYKDQIDNENNSFKEERAYSIGSSIMAGVRAIKSGITNFKNDPAGKTLSGISSFIGGGGRDGVQSFGKRLKTLGQETGNSYSKNIGRFIERDPRTAVALSIPVGVGITAGTWDLGEKVVNKTARLFDKDAYKYQDALYQEV